MAPVDKRVFLAGRRCHPYGWYVQHTPEEPPGPGLQWRFHSGAEIGARAREKFGGGRQLPRAPLDLALRTTAEAVRCGEDAVLFEASFAWQELVARADVLRRSNGGWTLIEVKSGKSTDDGAVKDEYLDDVSYTVCVAQRAGVPIDGVSLVLVNRDFRLGGTAPLLTEVDITEAAMQRAAEIAVDAQQIAAAVQAEERPAPGLSFKCRACEIFDTECLGVGVPDPLFVLPHLREKRFEELRCYERVAQIPAGTKLTPTQERIANVIRSGLPVLEDGLRVLDDIVWPAQYLDFEAVSPCVPWFEGRPPYDPVPFQYSLHLVTSPDAVPEHREYLAPTTGDWRRELAERLLQDLGTAGSIVVYSSYEKTRLNALAELFPDLQARLQAVISRLFDLERIFKDGYCHPGFAGSTSIKKVLPVMVDGLGYDKLAVGNGEDAAGVFALMRVGKYPAADHAAWRRKLLEYCGLDTMAMVRLHRALLEVRAAD